MQCVINMLQTVRFPFTVVQAMLATYTKLEWLINHILLFSQSTHSTHVTYTDYHPVWGSFRLAQIILHVLPQFGKSHCWIFSCESCNIFLPLGNKSFLKNYLQGQSFALHKHRLGSISTYWLTVYSVYVSRYICTSNG